MNRLEAIVLLTTSSEIKSGQFLTFCKQFQSMKYCGLTLTIFVNNSEFEAESTAFLNEITIFSSIQIFDIDIPKKDDIYMRNARYTKDLPRLGIASGPNILFFEAMKMCYSFNTILVLETDCKLKDNCFEVCKKYVNSMPDFLISGSKYLGAKTRWKPSEDIFHHLNGVAFYQIGNPMLQKLLQNVENFIVHKLKQKLLSMSYDVAIMAFVHEYIGKNDSETDYYRRVESMLIGNTFILNYSVDSDITQDMVDEWFPQHVILHSKLQI